MAHHGKASRRISQCAVVQAIANCGPISRASVAKQTGLSKQTVSEIVARFEEDNLVRAVGQTAGHVGRRAVVYEIVPGAALVASVDLGGTNVRTALCDLSGRIFAQIIEPTAPAGGLDVVHQIIRLIRQMAARSEQSFDRIRTAVIGVPGVPDARTGVVRMAPNIKGIDTINLAGSIRMQLGIEVIVENDVNLAALGEHWHGKQDDLVFLSIGTGIGAGIVVEGTLLRGSGGGAGEVGFLPFGSDPFDPNIHKIGALENVAATHAIIRFYEDRTGVQRTVPDIFDAAGAGDKAARAALDAVAMQIARAAVAIATLLDPSSIVVGGSIGAREELLTLVRRHVARAFPRPIPIELSRLGTHAALVGGAATALHNLHISLFAEGQNTADIVIPPANVENVIAGVA